jgi:methionyl-tRNA formyltransferase
LLRTLERAANGALQPRPQEEALACYATKLSKLEATLRWEQNALDLSRQVRALIPWPVAQTRYLDQVLRVWEADTTQGTGPGDLPAGTVSSASKQGIEVATGRGNLRLLRVQLPGGRALSAGEFLNAQGAVVRRGFRFGAADG